MRSFFDSMITQKQFYKTKAWQRARKNYIEQRLLIDGGICEVCGKDFGKIVHHKVWLNDERANDPSIALNPDNFRYECQTCHNKEVDTSEEVPGGILRRQYKYGPNGEILPR